ncbi:MAG: aspartate aminotransferase family protein [Spirochaetes bacterium]|nr:aspartate aminotransferase family protein [Spirochaetota bacterium]
MKRTRISIPERGLKKKDIIDMMKQYGSEDPDYKKLRTWSLVYYLGEEHTRFLQEAYNLYFSANGLNPMVFKSLKRFETEVVDMTASLLRGDENVCGVMTAGGTESCLLAVKTYRDMARDKKPWIKKPEMIIPDTAHCAWEKGAKYFDVKTVRAPLDRNFRLDVNAVKKMITRRTIMILGSAPEYPYGIVDPIERLGEIAVKNGIPLHVDACVGGYMLPFVEELGYDVPPWDFRVPGVTSISADTHKYGFSAKGASTILYRDVNIMKYQIFVYENWPGGIFASMGILGTRPGGSIAAAWGALQAIGKKDYLKHAGESMEATRRLIDGINSIPQLEVNGSPTMSLISYRSTAKDVNIYVVGDQMVERGWQIERQQRPDCLHAMVTPLHRTVIKQYIADLKKSVRYAQEHPEAASIGDAAMYGMISRIPLRGMIKKNVVNMMMDFYGPQAKRPAVSDGDGVMEGAADGPDLAQKAGLWYLKLMDRLKRR